MAAAPARASSELCRLKAASAFIVLRHVGSLTRGSSHATSICTGFRYTLCVAETILITGVSGLVGSTLAEALTARRDNVIGQVRGEPRAAQIKWDLIQPLPADDSGMRNAKLDAVVHLAGDPVFGLWTAAKKRRIRESRVMGTKNLVAYLAKMPPEQRPKTLVCAPAVGYYGDRDDEPLTEQSAPGAGFL